MADESPARITRVVLRNYKSIVSCDVELKPLTILVGPNGSGKSNFVDALRFVSEALTVGLEQAIRNRGNARRILSKGRASGEDFFSIELQLDLSKGVIGRYLMEIQATSDRDFQVRREQLSLPGSGQAWGDDVFIGTGDGSLTTWSRINIRGNSAESSNPMRSYLPDWGTNRLFFPFYVGMPEAASLFDGLVSMAFYHPQPETMRVVAPAESEQSLLPDGRNVASVLRRMQQTDSETMWRITTYLSRVLPGLDHLEVIDLRGYDLLIFHLNSSTESLLWDFTPEQMSDGTLRALGVLVALFQHRMGEGHQVSLVGMEEPETGLHPGAGGVLLHALMDASATTQVLVTTHSSSLLDSDDVDVESLLAVDVVDGITQIGPIDSVGRSILKDQLFTVGELLQMKQLRPTAMENGDALAPAISAPTPLKP